MGPEDIPEGIHNCLQLLHPQLSLACFASVHITFHLIHALMYMLMLRQQLQLPLESRHSLGEDGEDMLLLNRVVEVQMVAEFGGGVEELSDAHVCRAFAAGAGGIEDLPCGAEVVVEQVHRHGHPVIAVSILPAKRRKVRGRGRCEWSR